MNVINKLYCRLCAKQNSKNELIDLNSDNMKLNEICDKLIRLNAKINIFAVSLPKTVCASCILVLDTSYQFIVAVEKAQTILQDLVVVKKEREVNEDSTLALCCFQSLDIKNELSDTESDSELTDDTQVNVKNEIHNENKDQKLCKLDATFLNTCVSKQGNFNWNDYSWMCSVCETQFSTVNELQVHSIEQHSKCNAYSCLYCRKRRHDLDGFIRHVCTHKECLRLSCYKCYATFPAFYELKEHRRVHRTTDFVCIGCNASFPSEESLGVHKAKYYSNIRTIKFPEDSKLDGTCNVCRKVFKSSNSLAKHMLTHTERTRDYICEKCGKAYLTKRCLEQHKITHLDISPYECKICKMTFKTESYLRCHVIVHDEIKAYSCDQCEKRFRTLKQLNFHKKVHSDVWHECNMCSKRFKFKNKLALHLKLHNSIMPYSCEPCRWSFTNYSNYFKHMKGKHKTDIRKKKMNPSNSCVLEWKDWKEELTRKRSLGRPKKE